jgi:RNA polymerase sigma-70 factor (ECF subfamily)
MTGEEQERIAAAIRGDRQAFRRLVDAHARPLYRVALRITRDPALAEDAVQEALLNAWRHLPGFDARASFGTWLHRIAVNAALEQIRRRRRVDTDEAPLADDAPGLDLADEAPTPERRAEIGDLGRGIARELERLSDLERTAFLLRHHEGHSLEHIAGQLSLSVDSSKQAVFRAVRKLRLALVQAG